MRSDKAGPVDRALEIKKLVVLASREHPGQRGFSALTGAQKPCHRADLAGLRQLLEIAGSFDERHGIDVIIENRNVNYRFSMINSPARSPTGALSATARSFRP